jgi:eukaryotic-like serine/threonine-protein kinase
MNHAALAHGLPRPGEILAGKYRVESIVGAGGMGVVMSATDTSLGRAVAIKFLSPEKASKDGAIARFMREARAAASLESEHVVKVYEVATHTSGVPYIVMELLRGQDLSQVVASRGPLPMYDAADYLLQACEALSAAHARGIVHRDLKPQNLFLTQRADGSPCVKVLDFGISKAADSAEVNLTSTDMVMGTPLYMSPEQVRSLKSVDHRTDIWSLGAILQELLTQRPAFDGASASALCAAIAMDPPRSLRAQRPDLPPELEGVVLRCLHKDPAGRFPDVAALGAAIAPFASDRGRQSAVRLSMMPRHDSLHPNHVASLAPTLDGGSGPRALGSFGPPPIGMMSTQGTWGQSTQNGLTRTGEPPRSSAALVVLAGVLTGVFLLAAVGGAGYYMYSSRMDQPVASGPSPTAAQPGAAKTGAPVSVPGAARVGGDPAAAIEPDPTAPSAPATAPKPTAKPTAPAPPKPAPPAKPSSDPAADELAGRRRIAQSRCNHYDMMLRSNDPKNNDVAKRLKPQICLSAGGRDAARCERTLCERICTLDNDQMCISRMHAADRQFPTRF